MYFNVGAAGSRHARSSSVEHERIDNGALVESGETSEADSALRAAQWREALWRVKHRLLAYRVAIGLGLLFAITGLGLLPRGPWGFLVECMALLVSCSFASVLVGRHADAVDTGWAEYVAGLGSSPHPNVLPTILDALGHPSPGVRAAGWASLAARLADPEFDPFAHRALMNVCRRPSVNIRTVARAAVARRLADADFDSSKVFEDRASDETCGILRFRRWAGAPPPARPSRRALYDLLNESHPEIVGSVLRIVERERDPAALPYVERLIYRPRGSRLSPNLQAAAEACARSLSEFRKGAALSHQLVRACQLSPVDSAALLRAAAPAAGGDPQQMLRASRRPSDDGRSDTL